jgi:cytochrome c2
MKRQSMIGLLVAASMVGVTASAGMAAGGVGSPARVDSSNDVQPVRFDASKVQEGRALFTQVCSNCHTNEPNKNKIGPSLFGVVGRHAGSAPGFDYSQAMKGAPVTWNDETLDRYLADPKSFVPGNKMPYMGVKNDERRQGIIAYLHTLQ